MVQSSSESPSLHHAVDVHGATGCVSRLKTSGHVARASACDFRPSYVCRQRQPLWTYAKPLSAIRHRLPSCWRRRACRLEQSQTLIRAGPVRPPLVWSLLKLQAGCMRLARVCCSCTASSAGRLLPALLAVRACCSGGHHGMAVWPESGKIGTDLSSMIVNEVSRFDLTVYGGAGAGHWPRFRPRQMQIRAET